MKARTQQAILKGRKNDNTSCSRPRPHTEQEEQQVPDSRQVDNETGVSKGDKENHRRFRIGITVRFSDNRRRDLDGAMATIGDCIIAARGRLLDMDSRTKHKSTPLSKGNGGRDHNH